MWAGAKILYSYSRARSVGWQDLTIPDDKCQIAGFTHLSSRPSVRCVPQVHGSTELAKRRRTIYFRAENSNVSEQKVGSKEQFCRFRCDAADDHSDSIVIAGVPARRTCPDRLR